MDGIITKPNPVLPFIFLSLMILAFPIMVSSNPFHDQTSFPAALALHHVDHFHPTKSAQELLRDRMDRDVRRVQALHRHGRIPLNSSVYSGYSQESGEFFTRLLVGYPTSQSVQLIVDTGSDLTWLQCEPCEHCYKQTGPIFNPALSRSFALITCGSKLCSFQSPHGCGHNDTCIYRADYGDSSYSEGQLVTESLTFRTRRLARVIIGCGVRNRGIFAGAGGILGLGQGNVSFPVRKGYLFNYTFSYCFVNLLSSKDSSWLLFGEAALSKQAVFTPMVMDGRDSTFYKVNLTEILVDDHPISLPADMQVIVDSGTSITRLGQGVYTALRDAFLARNKDLKLVDSPLPGLFDTCFNMSGREDVYVTPVEFGFQDGARMDLPADNILLPWDDKGTFCLAMAATTDRLSILGNVQQQGFRFVFELHKKLVGIAPDSCINSD